jgi:hypothetical protein
VLFLLAGLYFVPLVEVFLFFVCSNGRQLWLSSFSKKSFYNQAVLCCAVSHRPSTSCQPSTSCLALTPNNNYGKQTTNSAPAIAMIACWQQSGESHKFCLQNNIAYHVFHYRYKVYRNQASANNGSFVAVNISTELQPNVDLRLTDGKCICFHQTAKRCN